jgi:uncharacterized caspase-like protein
MKRAVVIGVNKYEDDPIRDLKGAVNDAQDVYARLVDPECGGFEIANEHYLLDERATFDAVRQAMSDLLWKTEQCDFSLFYFSGHGFRDGYNNGYIAPRDIKRDEPFVRGIRMQELLELVQTAKNKETIVVILDCCYSGIAAEGNRGDGSGARPVPFDEWFAALDHEERGKGRVILASSGQDEESRELGACSHTLSFGEEMPHTHGTFTFHLLEALDGKAATIEGDGITLEGLRQYIDEQMRNDPEHQPTYSGAGMRQADRIVIARASRWRNIDQKLREARRYLEMGDPTTAFAAVKALGGVMSTCSRLKKAIDLKTEIDERLSEYQNPAVAWLLDERMDLGPRFPTLYGHLRELAGQLSVDTILREQASIHGLLISLCEVSCKKPGCDEPYISKETFVRDLAAKSSDLNQRGSNATSKPSASGQQLPGVATNG